MKIRYDEKSDALYIRFREAPYFESDEIKEGFILDMDQSGNIIGIEILDASNYLQPGELSSVSFEVTTASQKKIAV
jgi:uncharacterized protein YuzE